MQFSFNRQAMATDMPSNVRPIYKVPTQSAVQTATDHPLAKATAIQSQPTVGETLPVVINRWQGVDGGDGYDPGLNDPLPGGRFRTPLPIIRRPITLPILKRLPVDPPIHTPPAVPPQPTNQNGDNSAVKGSTPPPPPPPPQDPGQLLLGGGDSVGGGAGGIGTSISIPSPVVIPGNNGGGPNVLILGIIASVAGAAIWYYMKHRHHGNTNAGPAE